MKEQGEKLFDRSVYNIILIHTARTWERLRLTQEHEEMPLDNISSTEAIEEVSTEIINSVIIQEFLTHRDGSIWDRSGYGCSDAYIDNPATKILVTEFLND